MRGVYRRRLLLRYIDKDKTEANDRFLSFYND
jgi:hypothetical protein